MNTLLLIGGDLCARTAGRLDPTQWRITGLRRRAIAHRTGDLIRWRQADLGDPASLATALRAVGEISHILYAPAPGQRTPEAYQRTYPEGLAALLQALPVPGGLRRCVLVDSTAVWGPSPGWVNEATPTDPDDFRGTLMLRAEALLHEQLGSDPFTAASGTALRLSGLYGPGRLRLVDALRAGRMTAPDGPGHWANRIHVDDAAAACAHLLTLPAPKPCYIGTDDRPLPTAAFYEAIAALTGAPRPAHASRPPDGKQLSNARLRASGWTPRWPDMLEGYAAALAARTGGPSSTA